MKSILGVILGVSALASIGSAQSLAACGTSPIPFANLLPGGSESGGCEIGNYEFTDFVVTSGAMAGSMADVTATFAYGSRNETGTFNLNDASGFVENFTLTYTLTLDQTQPPANISPGDWNVIEATAGLQDDPGPGPWNDNATWEKAVLATVGTGTGSVTVVDTDGTASPGAIDGLAASVLDVTDTFNITNIGNSDILNMSNIYYQYGPAAEPSTMILMGVALVGLGVVVRKRRKACA